MLLNELNTSFFPFIKRFKSDDQEMYVFKSSNASFLVVIYFDPDNTINIEFDAKSLVDNTWTYLKTGNAGAEVFKIFSTVLEILKTVLKEHKETKNISFEAKSSEHNRVKLYKRFITQIDKFLPGWKLKKLTGGPGDYHESDYEFTLERK